MSAAYRQLPPGRYAPTALRTHAVVAVGQFNAQREQADLLTAALRHQLQQLPAPMAQPLDQLVLNAENARRQADAAAQDALWCLRQACETALGAGTRPDGLCDVVQPMPDVVGTAPGALTPAWLLSQAGR